MQDILDSIISQHKKSHGVALKKPKAVVLKTKPGLVRKSVTSGLIIAKPARPLKSIPVKKKTAFSQKVEIVGDSSANDHLTAKHDTKQILSNKAKSVVSIKSSTTDKDSKKSDAKPILKASKKPAKELNKRKRVSFGKDEVFKKDDDAPQPPSKKFKPSALFANNPKIPKVDCDDVTPLSENVFSKTSFASLNLHPFMVSNLEKMNITKLTAVQKKAIPIIMQGKDILVKSQTGSGKTMSYAIPIVQELQSMEPKIQRTDGPYCVVVVPTRELVAQSYEVLMKLVNPFLWVVPGQLMGGEKRKSEKARIRKGMNIIVSTPGRLVDHLDHTCSLELGKIRYLVIDEADRMLDMGFERDISRIILVMNNKCKKFQTILLSATLSPGVEKLAGMSLEEPARIDMAQANKVFDDGAEAVEEFATPSSLKHHFVVVPSKLRLVTLASFLLWKCQLNSNPCKVIVFLSTQSAVEFHHSLFQSTFFSPEDNDEAVREFEIFKLYGDMEQKDRMKIFKEFKAAKSGVLLCTDVASRGLDLPHIEWIVQYNTPGSPTDYIHRAGRTARIGTKGNALLFLAPSEVEYVKVMTEHKIAMNEIPMDNILKYLLIQAQMGKLNLVHKGHTPSTLQDAAAFLQAQFEENLSQNKNMRTLARKAYQSFIRAYTTYPASLKHIFHVKNLHLGHVATSFALAETPSGVSKLVGNHHKNSKAAAKKFFSPKGHQRTLPPTQGAKKIVRDRKERIKIPFGFDKTSLKTKLVNVLIFSGSGLMVLFLC